MKKTIFNWFVKSDVFEEENEVEVVSDFWSNDFVKISCEVKFDFFGAMWAAVCYDMFDC